MNDLNTKDLRKKFIKNLLPSVAAMWVYSIYTIIDGIFVGKGVGATALASVNIAMPFVNVIFALSIFFATGASTLISISLGYKDIKKSNEIFTYNIFIMAVFSILLTLFSFIFIDKIAYFLGATDITFNFVVDYLRIIVVFSIFFIISYCLEVLTKADGFPHLAIIGVIISAVMNIILDYIFVILLGLGVKGAAFATGISQIASCLFFLMHFLSSKSTLKFTKFKFDLNIFLKIISIGFPDGVTELTSGIVILIFNQSILRFIGNDGVITYSIICYVLTLVIMTMIGITQGAQPLCSFYYGAENTNAVKYIFKITLKTILSSSILIFLICIVFSSSIVSLFLSKDNIELFNNSVMILKIYSISFLILGINVLISGFFVSIEKPLYATIVSLSRGFILVILFLSICIVLYGGKGIWISTILSEATCLILSYYLIKKKGLQENKL